ncbi:MAG: alpha-amylase family glycosyl hydrolase [Anaerolineales bacterium]
MSKRIFLTLLLILLIPSCVPAAPTVAPTPTAEATPETWWSNAVFYEIFVRSFNDSDGDGIGDFNGITQKLDYLQELGITAVWLMPIFPSPSYHGYDVMDYYDVNPQYGTMDDFKNLVAEAHKRDIRIILDLVINHTSDKHPWFKEAKKDVNSPYRNWYIWSDTDPKYVGPWGEKVWHSSTTGFYYGIFEAFMPDLNYNNPAVTEEMKKVASFWLKDIGVDGFRLDAAKHLIEEGTVQQNTQATHLWFQDEFYPATKAINPEAMTVGELFGDGLNTIAAYVKNDQFDLAFNFQLANSFISAAQSGKAGTLASTLKVSSKAIPDDQYASFLTNHDQERVMSQLGGDVDKAKLAAFLLLTSPGTPFIYYGEEIGMQGKKPDENIRRPMQWNSDANAGFTTGKPWRAPDAKYEAVNVAAQSGAPASLLEHYRALIQLRNNNITLQTGSLIPLKSNKPSVYAAIRTDENGSFLILANLGNQAVSDYYINLSDSGLAESAYGLETVFGTGQATGLEGSGEAFQKYIPFENLDPFAMYVLKINPK